MTLKSVGEYIETLSNISILNETFKLDKLIKRLCNIYMDIIIAVVQRLKSIHSTNADAVIHDLCYRCCDAVIVVSIDALIPVILSILWSLNVFDAKINIIDAVIPVNDK
jgi:hypothetical protein